MCVCVSVCARLGRALTQSTLSPERRRRPGLNSGPLGHSVRAATLSRPQPVCIRVPYQWLARPGFFNHSCPLSWLRRWQLPSHPLEMSLLETLSAAHWPRPRPTPALRWGRGATGRPERSPGDPGPLPAPPRGRPGPRRAHSVPAARPLFRRELSRPGRPEAPALHPQSGPGARSRERHILPARLPAPRLSGPPASDAPSSPLLGPADPLFLLGRPASLMPS